MSRPNLLAALTIFAAIMSGAIGGLFSNATVTAFRGLYTRHASGNLISTGATLTTPTITGANFRDVSQFEDTSGNDHLSVRETGTNDVEFRVNGGNYIFSAGNGTDWFDLHVNATSAPEFESNGVAADEYAWAFDTVNAYTAAQGIMALKMGDGVVVRFDGAGRIRPSADETGATSVGPFFGAAISLDSGTIAASDCTPLTGTVSGVVVSGTDICLNAQPADGVFPDVDMYVGGCWVSGANTVTVMLCADAGGVGADPAAEDYDVIVISLAG